MRERTPSADDTPKRAPPAPPREADVVGAKPLPSLPIEWYRGCGPRMVASTHNLEDLGLNHPTSASDEIRQQQNAQTKSTQDKRSRLSSVIANLRKKVPEQSNAAAGSDSRTSVERNLESLEKYVMTVLNGVINEQQQQDEQTSTSSSSSNCEQEPKVEPPEPKDEASELEMVEPAQPNEAASTQDDDEEEKKSLGEIIMDRLGEPRQDDVRAICWGILNDLVQSLELEPELQPSGLTCSLPLEKVASVLQACQERPKKSPGPTIRHLCLYCDRKFLSISLRQRHVERVHQTGGRRSERNANKQPQNCQYCSDKCPDGLDALFQHLLRSHRDKYHGCGQCSTRYSTKDALTAHLNEVHAGVVETLQEKPKDAKVIPPAVEVPDVEPAKPLDNAGSSEFDTSFYSNISCNIRENLLHHIDGKLQMESKPAVPEGGSSQAQMPIDISLTAATPVYSKDYVELSPEEYSEHAQKPGKNSHGYPRRVSYEKYNFPRKYDWKEQTNWSSIQDLSKFDISTQITLRKKQQIIKEKALQEEKEEQTEGAEGTSFSDDFGRFLRLKKVSENEEEKSHKPETVFVGEWSKPRIYVCAACASRFITLKELDDHKMAAHPNTWCTHFEFSGDQRELYKHLYLPGRSVPTAKARNALLPEKICTKCAKNCSSLAELHRHMLECAGDQVWLLGLFGNGKKKCKWRPFGSRSRRRRRGMKRNIQNSQYQAQPYQPRGNTPKEKPPPGPRVRPSDRESIQKMLENLPPKRMSKKVLQENNSRTRRNAQSKLRPRMVTDNTKKRTAHKKGSLKEKVLQNEKRMQRKRNQLDNPTPEESLATENAHEEDKAESMPSRITRESAKQNHQFGINNGGKTKGVRVLATKRSLKFKETANSLRSKGISSTKSSNSNSNPDSKVMLRKKRYVMTSSAKSVQSRTNSKLKNNSDQGTRIRTRACNYVAMNRRAYTSEAKAAKKANVSDETEPKLLLETSSPIDEKPSEQVPGKISRSSSRISRKIEADKSIKEEEKEKSKKGRKSEDAAAKIKSRKSLESKEKKNEEKSKSDEEVGVPEETPAVRPKKSLRKKEVVTPGLRKSLRIVDKKNSEEDTEVKAESSFAESSIKVEEVGRKRRSRVKSTEEVATSNEEEEASKDEVANCAEGTNETETLLNVAVDKLQQECCQASVDSGKENLSEVPVNVLKPKIMRSKKTKGQKKEIGPKRSLSNVIGILTEGMNIPVEVQDSVVFTVQTSGEVNIETVIENNQTQEVIGCETVEIVQEKESSTVDLNPVKTEELKTKDETEHNENIELKSKSVELPEEPPTSDIILDLSRRKQTGKGSFLEKIVSKIVQKKDPHLLNCFSNNVENESFKDKTEVQSRVQLELQSEVKNEVKDLNSKEEETLEKESKEEKTLKTEEVTEKENPLIKESTSEQHKSIEEEKALKTENNLEVKPLENEEKLEKIEEVQIDNQGGKKNLNKRFSDGATSVRNKRRTVPEENEEKEEQDELQLADIMELINQPRETVTPTSSESLFGKRKSIDGEEVFEDGQDNKRLKVDPDQESAKTETEEDKTIDKEVTKEPVLINNVPDVPEILENVETLKKLPLRKTNSKSKNESLDEKVSVIVPVKGRSKKGGRRKKKENVKVGSEISSDLNSTENDCVEKTDDVPKKRTRAVRNKSAKSPVEVPLVLNQSEEENQPKLDTQNQSDFQIQPDVQNQLEDQNQSDVQNQPELQNLESSPIEDQPIEEVSKKRSAPKKKSQEDKKSTKTEPKRTSKKKSLKDEHLELKETSILDETLVKEDPILNETLPNSISIDPSINIVTSTPVEKKETMKRNQKKKSLLDEHLDLPETDGAISVAEDSLTLNSNTQSSRKRRSAPKRKVVSDCTPPEIVVPIKADLIPTEVSLETQNLSLDLPQEEETPKIPSKKKRNKKVPDLKPSNEENLAGEKDTVVDQGKKSGKKTSLIDEHLDLNSSQVTLIECKEQEEPMKKKRSSSRKKVEVISELSQSLPKSNQLQDSTLEPSISPAVIVKDLDVSLETTTVTKGKAKRNSSKKKSPEIISAIQKIEATEDKPVELSLDLKIPQSKKGSKKKSLLDEHLDLSQSAEISKEIEKAEVISMTESLTEVCEQILDSEVITESKKKGSKNKSLVDEHVQLNISPIETPEQEVAAEQVVKKISEVKTTDEELVLNKSHQEILQEVLLLEKKKKVTKEAPKFFCEYCACSFTRKSSLKKHNQSQSHILQLSAGAKLKIVEEKKDEKKAEVEEEAEVEENPEVAKKDVEVASESKLEDDEVDFSEPFLLSENKQSLEDLLLDEEICKITENMSHDEYVLTDHISPDHAEDLKDDKFSKLQKKARSKKVTKKTSKKKRNLAEEHLELNSPKEEEPSEVSLTAETISEVQEEVKKEEMPKVEEKIAEVEEPQILQENVRPKRKTYRQSYRESDHELDLDFCLGQEVKQKVKLKKPKTDASPSEEISKSECFQNLLENPTPELKVDLEVGAEFDSSDNSLDTNMSADIQKIIDDPKLTDEETKNQKKSGSCKKDKKKAKSPKKKKSSDVSDNEDKVEVKSKRKIVTSVFARALAADKVEKMKEFLDDWDSNEEDLLEQNNIKGLSENEENNKVEMDEVSSPRSRQSKKRAEERISKSFEEDFEPKIENGKVNEPSVIQADQPEEDEDDDDGISCRDLSPIFAYNTLDSSLESNSFVSRGEEKNVEDSSKSEFSGEKIVIRSQDRTEVVTIAPTDAIEDNALDVPHNKMRQGKVLNFDEELFVECCSRLKATSEKELRGAKKIKLDQSEGYHRKDEQQIRERDRWRDADSQNSLGSLLESVNQLLGEDISSNREQDYKKRSQKPASAWSSRSASPDASRPDNIGYEDSLDVAFEHNNKLRDKIQQRMRESESLLVNTYGQKDTNQEFHKSSSFSFEINSSPGRVRSLDKTISNLLHNGKQDHNGSNPMKVLAELACARVPNSMPEPLTPQKSPIIRESLFTSDVAKDRKSRNPIKELFERKKEINERKEQIKITPKIEIESQKKLKKVKKNDFPLIKNSQRGGLSEKKKRKDEKRNFDKEKDIYDFDDEETQVTSSFSSGLSYRNKNGDSLKVKEASEVVVRSQEGEKFAPKTKGALKCFHPDENKEESVKDDDEGEKQAMRKKTSNPQNKNQKSKKKPKMLKRKSRNSWYENDSSDEFITAVKAEEEVGVGISKSQRNCSKGKQNLFAELSTSSESEFEDRKSPVIVNQPEEKEMEKQSWQSVLKKTDSEFSDRSLVIDENKIEDDNKSDDENDYQRSYELDDFREDSSMESSVENEKTNGFESDEKSVKNESAKSVRSNSTRSILRSSFSDENSDRDEKEDEDEDDDETVNLPEKLSSNEKPEPKSDNLPLHVFLSRKVQESKKRKEEQEQKRLEEEQMKMLEGMQLSRKPRKCAIGKQGLLAEFSSSDEDFSERTPRRKRESKETKKERYLEKQREKRFANEQKAIEEMILRDVKSKKEQGRDEKDERGQTETSENEKSFEERDSSMEKKKQLLQDVSKEENGKKEHKKVEKAKVENKGEKKKVAVNNEKSKSKSLPTPKEKDRRPDGRKRESDDEELSTTKYWNRVEEGVGVAIGRRKRAAVNQLYYWSSSSDDEDLTSSIVPLEVEADDERQEQHGWIVGDSHKRMITMLAMEKRRRSEDEHETKPKKHRNGLS